MRPIRRSAAVLLLLAGPLGSGCECSERPLYELDEAEGTTFETEATTTEGLTASGGWATEGASTGEPIDVSPFLGIFHAEYWILPFGQEEDTVGGVPLANLEIRPDGTASMTWETCNKLQGTREFEWTWEARPGPVLDFSPAPKEDSLDYFALTELESLRAFLIEDCAFRFEADGEVLITETFRPGLACWVNRCDNPPWMIHLDYCDGEGPPPCE